MRMRLRIVVISIEARTVMDSFMDEIVQKFTPQDMIRANAAAEAAEIESLEKQLTLFKEQMDKYDDCLTEMRTLNLKNIESAQDVQQLADKAGEHIGKTAEESVTGIRKMIDESLAKIEEIKGHADNTEEITGVVREVQAKTEEIIKNLEDYLHTDNVKVYRNVQAAMTEELDSRTQELKQELEKVQKKTKVLFPFVLISMILGVAQLAVLILLVLGIL